MNWAGSKGKWRARLWIDGVTKHLGYFEDEDEAARRVDEKARELNAQDGQDRGMNFPREGERVAIDKNAEIADTVAKRKANGQQASPHIGVTFVRDASGRSKWRAQTSRARGTAGTRAHVQGTFRVFDDEAEAARVSEAGCRWIADRKPPPTDESRKRYDRERRKRAADGAPPGGADLKARAVAPALARPQSRDSS